MELFLQIASSQYFFSDLGGQLILEHLYRGMVESFYIASLLSALTWTAEGKTIFHGEACSMVCELLLRCSYLSRLSSSQSLFFDLCGQFISENYMEVW